MKPRIIGILVYLFSFVSFSYSVEFKSKLSKKYYELQEYFLFFYCINHESYNLILLMLSYLLDQYSIPHIVQKMKTVNSSISADNNDNKEDGYKKAEIVKPNFDDNDTPNNNKHLINQRVNYLSNVISNKPTNTLLKRGYNNDSSITYDLDNISKH